MRDKLKALLSASAALLAFAGIFLFVDLSEALAVVRDSDRRYVSILFVSMTVATLMRGYVYVRLLSGTPCRTPWPARRRCWRISPRGTNAST